MLPDVIDLLAEMIRTDSRNTAPLEAQVERIATEEAMSRIVERCLTEMGFGIEEQFIAPHRPNVIGFRDCGTPGAPIIGYNAHLDTVGTDNMTIPPFEPVIKDGMIYGRGSADTKCALAAMLKASEKLIQEQIPVSILFVATSSEETGCQGSALLDLGKYRCDGFMVGEPTSCLPVVFHKNHVTVRFACRGKSAHGSRPELGDNAVVKAARLVVWLDEVARPRIEAITSPNFTRGCTFGANVIHGGRKGNIVPDFCEVECDIRLLPEVPEYLPFLKKLAEDATEALGFPVEITYQHGSHAMGTPVSHPFVQAVCHAVREFGNPPDPISVAYCTDGGNISAMGFPCVVLGPGDIANAHGAVEYAPVEQIRQAVDIYAMVGRLLSDQKTQANTTD